MVGKDCTLLFSLFSYINLELKFSKTMDSLVVSESCMLPQYEKGQVHVVIKVTNG